MLLRFCLLGAGCADTVLINEKLQLADLLLLLLVKLFLPFNISLLRFKELRIVSCIGF